MKKYFLHAAADLPASIVVFLVAIPLCLGIAVASGLSEFSGLIGGISGGIVVGMLSGSQLSVSGPAAGLTAIVAAAVLKLPSAEAFFLAVVLAGCFQILLGIFKLGIIGDYVPNSVIKGMLAAIGIILILKQLPHLVGYDKDYEGDETFIQVSGENTFSTVINSLNHFTPVAVLIGVLGIAVLIIYETKWVKSIKLFRLFSGPLAVVLIGVLINSLTGNIPPSFSLNENHLVNIPVAKNAEEFFSFFKFPDWKQIMNTDVWITAFTLALVASLETLLGLEAIDKLDPLKRVSPTNRELLAQGTGNIVSGLLGGLPLTSVIVRSSANIQAGARSKWSAVFHGVFMLICIAFFPALLNSIPKAALAAILVYTGYKLAKPSLAKLYFKKGWDQFMPFIITLLSIVFTDLLTGVLIGIAVGIFYIIRSNFRTAIFVINDNNRYLIRLRKDVSFFCKPVLKSKLEAIPSNAIVIIDLTRAEFIDRDIADTINEYLLHAHLKKIHVSIDRSIHNNSHQLIGSGPKQIFESSH